MKINNNLVTDFKLTYLGVEYTDIEVIKKIFEDIELDAIEQAKIDALQAQIDIINSEPRTIINNTTQQITNVTQQVVEVIPTRMDYQQQNMIFGGSPWDNLSNAAKIADGNASRNQASQNCRR